MASKPLSNPLGKEAPASRFSHAHIQQWRDEGLVIIPDFFSTAEIIPIKDEYIRLYGTQADASLRDAVAPTTDAEVAAARLLQFKNIHIFPYDALPAMNLISLHPALIDLSRQLLGVDAVHMYQSHTWAKFTGETNYDQLLHCDFPNHTLTVPSDSIASRTVDFILYFTDVTDAHGALHYVTKPDAAAVLCDGAITVKPEQQGALQAKERSAVGTSGTLVAHSIDTFHRGTNLTLKDGYRYTMTTGYKAAGNDMIGYHVWQQRGDRNWSDIFAHASPQQLACLGIPLPADPYWTERTLTLNQARWPQWDMREYFAAHP
ncbi:MAG: hypothetical protein ACI9SB_000381 [Candidatus Azotimanducaceae bacterium]